jgi:tetratricopeptide (TPR) repeat protein
MSLLLDALKRAEQEKLAKQGDRPEPERTRPVAVSPANESTTPSLELAPIQGAATSGAVPPLRGDTATAQNIFQAKAPAANERSRKGVWLWVGLGVLVLGLGTAGVYTWLSVASFTPRIAASARPRAAPIAQAPPSFDAPAKIDILMSPPQQPTAAIQPPATAEPANTAPAARSDPRPAQAEALAALLRDSASQPAAPPMRLAPSAQVPRVPTEVAAGYAALRNGDVALARRSYAAAIAADPGNVDAQLGVATIEARSGNRMLAASHYRKALDIDPRNGTALAGLASLADYSQSDGLESHLRADIARDALSPQLQYTLGNLYASQSRWNEAQVEYFEAHRLDPASADILYNLAVSLDHLRQAHLAAEYYRRALGAARDSSTQFDPGPVTRRLAELK